MRFFASALLLCSSILAQAAPSKKQSIASCQSFLLAPAGLQQATRALLSLKTGHSERRRRKEQIQQFVAEAPLGSNAVVDYLRHLAKESPDEHGSSVSAFSERQLAIYLMRAGNEELALERLPVLLDIFWTSYVSGNTDPIEREPGYTRVKEGYAWMENILQFVTDLAKSQPQRVANDWYSSYDKAIPKLIDSYGFEKIFARALGSLKARRGPTRDDLERLEYLKPLIKELEYMPFDESLDSLIQLYTIDEPLFPHNDAFRLDMELSRGTKLDAMNSFRAFVFLYRLERRLDLHFPQKRLSKIEREIQEIKQAIIQRLTQPS
jgi:hypothetical protein